MTPTLTKSAVRLTAIAAVTLVAACSAPRPEPTPAPAPAPAPTVAAPAPMPTAPGANWHDNAATPGDWLYRLGTSGESRATFVTESGSPLFQMICTVDKRVVLARIGARATGDGMRIYTETATRTVPAEPRDDATLATMSARDPLLDAMAFARGRFAVHVEGTQPLYIPAWPEVGRVIEDCR